MNRRGPGPSIVKDGRAKKSPKMLRAEAQKRDEKEQALLSRARKRFDRCVSAESENRKHAVDDLKFKTGEGQWPADVVSQRNFDVKPTLTLNKLPTFVNQVVNPHRMNRPAINISPVGDKSDPEVAKMYRGLIRAIERNSQADIAYDTGFDSAVSMGWGYWRVMIDYESPSAMDQTIYIKRIRNPFTVYLDPMHQEPDGADARYGFITEMVTRREFEDDYPDADPMPWSQAGTGDDTKTWVSEHEIRVAEYFEIDVEKRRLVELENGHIGWYDELSEDGKNSPILSERMSEFPTVNWYKLTATQILSEREWPGKWIPIIKVVGNEVDIEGKVRLSGLIRAAKQPQMLYNYMRAMDLNTPLPTPTGWTTMGAVQAGDRLLDERGQPCTVTAASPVHIHWDCHEITFDDGTVVIVDSRHPWPTEERGKAIEGGWQWLPKLVETKNLQPKKHFIYTTEPLELPDAELSVHPYMLGVWLGDGSSLAPKIHAGRGDVEEMRNRIAGCGYSVSPSREHKTACDFTVYGLAPRLRELGVWGDKHIPQVYLRGSERQRRALLQGLMDTDGTIGGTNQYSFTTTSERLADGFAELVRSLGIKAVAAHRAGYLRKFPNGRIYECSPAIVFSFSAYEDDAVFCLARKRAKVKTAHDEHRRRTRRHAIRAVRPVASVPVRCVTVDSPSHLFLATSAMIPTHNTTGVEITMLQPKAPYIVAEGQLEGYEDRWKQANNKTYPYLEYRPVTIDGKPAPPPQRQPFQGAGPAIAQEAQVAAQDMMGVTGIRFDGTLQERMYDESGRALKELRERGDTGSFHYEDNFARSLRHCGEILVDLIPKVYETKRIVTILREDDSEEQVQLDPSAEKPMARGQNPKTSKAIKIFNPTYGRYGVTVTIGPSYASKRIESAESIMDFMRALGPAAAQLIPLIADLVAKNQDWQGAEQIAKRLASTLPPNMLAQEMDDVPPQVQALISGLQRQLQAAAQEKAQLIKALTEQQADRAQRQDKIEKDFEAKLLNIVAQLEAKMAAVSQKSEQATIDRVMAPVGELVKGVSELRDALGNSETTDE